MKKLEWPGIATAAMIALLFVFSTWLGVAGPVWNAVGIAAPNEWLGFAGNVIGGIMTLAAAAVAWFAVQHQIRAAEKLSTALHDETFDAVTADLRDVLELLNEQWRTVDHAMVHGLTPQAVLDRRATAGVACGHHQTIPFETFERLSGDLTPLRNRALKAVLAQLHIVDDALRDLAQANAHDQQMEHLITMAWINLSHLHRYLVGLSAELAAIFDGRRKANVNHQNAAAHLRPFVDERLVG